MRIIIIAFLLATFCPALWSQDKLPSFGKIDKADLEMTTCSFDTEAAAMFLIDRGEVNYNFSGSDMYIQTDMRQRIKILKENGISRANIKFDYYSKDKYEEISNLEGYVYNLDAAGNVVTTKLDKSAFYNKPLDSKYNEIAIAFPQVKVGTVIEYSYRSYKKNNFQGLKDWIFQGSIPCRYSEYSLYIPEYFEFTYLVTRRQPLEFKSPTSSKPCYFYAMRNIPSLKHEPYMNGFKDYIQKVEFQLASVTYSNGDKKSYRDTWEKLTEELLEHPNFGQELKRNIPNTEKLELMLKLAHDTLEKMKMIYTYVQQNMEWDGSETIYTDGVKKAWDKKSGSVTDINLLLVDLLREAGVKAYPMLVSTKENGRLNVNYPYLYQFNEVMAYTEIDGQPYCLNAADKLNPYFLIPYSVQATQGFLVDKKMFGWKSLKNPTQKYKQSVSVMANMDSTGHFTGEAYVASSGYARNARLKAYKQKQLNQLFTKNDIEPDSIAVKNITIDSLPFEQKAAFHGSLEKSGDFFFLSYNLFSGLEENMPFTADKRESNIDFNYLQSYTINGSYVVPAGFTFEGLPKNMTLIMPDTSITFKRYIQVSEDNLVSFMIKLEFNRTWYSAEEYADLKEYFNKMYELLDERIVVKKK